MATEKRLIDANDVYALFGENGMARLHVGDIDQIKRVDAVEVVHGRWIGEKGGYMWRENCSVCGNPVYNKIKSYNYCPYCGAKMDGDGNGC